jgi:hypothetical protein
LVQFFAAKPMALQSGAKPEHRGYQLYFSLGLYGLILLSDKIFSLKVKNTLNAHRLLTLSSTIFLIF